MSTRQISLLFKQSAPFSTTYEVGDVALFSAEEAERLIAAGVATPCRPDIDEINIRRLLAGLPDTKGVQRR